MHRIIVDFLGKKEGFKKRTLYRSCVPIDMESSKKDAPLFFKSPTIPIH